MSISLTEDELWAFLGECHTGILATLRSDGAPAVMPLWFVIVDRAVCLRTLRASAKTSHIETDSRVSFLVECGKAWAELKAVVLYGRAKILEPGELTARIDDAFTAKYAEFVMPSSAPDSARAHYEAARVHLRIAPTRRPRTWDNSKLLP